MPRKHIAEVPPAPPTRKPKRTSSDRIGPLQWEPLPVLWVAALFGHLDAWVLVEEARRRYQRASDDPSVHRYVDVATNKMFGDPNLARNFGGLIHLRELLLREFTDPRTDSLPHARRTDELTTEDGSNDLAEPLELLARLLRVESEWHRGRGGRPPTRLPEEVLAAAWWRRYDPTLGRARLEDVAEALNHDTSWLRTLYQREHPNLPWEDYRPSEFPQGLDSVRHVQDAEE